MSLYIHQEKWKCDEENGECCVPEQGIDYLNVNQHQKNRKLKELKNNELKRVNLSSKVEYTA